MPLATTLKGGAVAKGCSALLAKSLAEEVALSRKEAQAAPEKVFHTAEDEKPMTLRITALGRKALNGEAANEPSKLPKNQAARRASKATGAAPQTAAPASREKKAARARKGEAAAENQPRAGTKLEQFVKLLRRPKGVSIKEASEALDRLSTRCAARSRARSRRRTA